MPVREVNHLLISRLRYVDAVEKVAVGSDAYQATRKVTASKRYISIQYKTEKRRRENERMDSSNLGQRDR